MLVDKEGPWHKVLSVKYGENERTGGGLLKDGSR